MLGYARVSTSERELALQLDALEPRRRLAGFTVTASGAPAHRPELERVLDHWRGRQLVVWPGRASPDRAQVGDRRVSDAGFVTSGTGRRPRAVRILGIG